MKPEKYWIEQIALEIKRIAAMENNKKVANEFWKALNDVKPKSCLVKTGWHSGDNISFSLAYKKGGNRDPFMLFIENIEEKAETHGFICGLFPEIFHYAPQYNWNDDDNYCLMFKLKRNGQERKENM